MPIIAGQPFYDASGNAMTDASGNAIGEPDLPIGLLGGLVVMAGENPLGDLLDTVSDIFEAIQDLTTGALEMQAIRNLQDDMNAFLLNGGPDTFTGHDPTSHPSLISAEGIINSISIPSGGLTEAEHNLLMSLENVDPDDVAYAVWHNTTQVSGLDDDQALWTFQDLLESIFGSTAALAGYEGIVAAHTPYYALVTPNPMGLVTANWKWSSYAERNFPDEPDWAEVEEGDTPYTFLSRTQPTYGWTDVGPTGISNGEVAWKDLSDFYGAWVRSNFSTRQLASVVNETTIVNNTTEIASPLPLWPGSAGVTLGTPVALVDQLYLVAPMDGVIVSVTTPPTKTGRYSIGGATYDYGVGRMSFQTDSGDIEPFQYLGFRAGIYTPKSMQRAAAARFQVLGGAEGTVTPWTKG